MFFVYGVYNNSLEMMFIRFRFINPEGIRNETIVPGRVFLEKTI